MGRSNVGSVLLFAAALCLFVGGVYYYLQAQNDDISVFSSKSVAITKRMDKVEESFVKLDEDYSAKHAELVLKIGALQDKLNQYHEELGEFRKQSAEAKHLIPNKTQRIIMKMVAPEQPIPFTLVPQPKPLYTAKEVKEAKKAIQGVSK